MDPVTIAIMVAVASAGIYQSYQTKEMTEDQLKMESERVELEATQESVARYEALNAALASQIAAAGATGGISGSAGDVALADVERSGYDQAIISGSESAAQRAIMYRKRMAKAQMQSGFISSITQGITTGASVHKPSSSSGGQSSAQTGAVGGSIGGM